MAGDAQTTPTIEELIASGAIIAHKDGNYGSSYPRVEEFGSDGVPFLTAKSLRDGYVDIADAPRLADARADELRFGFIETDDVLLSHNATIGRVAVVPQHKGRLLVGTSLTYFRLNPQKLLPRYFAVYLAGSDFQNQLVAVMSHSTRNHVPVTAQRKLRVVVPPLAEQEAIAAMLGALDDKIELNRRMNAALEAMARALFQSWFVDFNPVRAKLDGRKPAGLDGATAALFPEHFEDTEDGKLPVGWRQTAIDEVCAINAWTLGKNDDLEALEYVEISEVSRGDIAHIASYTRGKEPSRARRRLRHGDTVLSTVRPDRGSYFLALNPPENRVASTGFAVLTPTKVPWPFVHAAMTQPDVSEHLGQMADGGAYPAVRPEIIGAMKVALPNEPKILEAFHGKCAPLFEQAEANRTQSRTLAILRDTLLPKLLSGEMKLKAR